MGDLLPEDLWDLNWEEYSDGFTEEALDAFVARISDVEPDLIATAIRDETLSIESGVDLVLRLTGVDGHVRSLERLQTTLAGVYDVSEDYDDFPVQLTELMLKILEVVELESRANPNSPELREICLVWLRDPDWTTRLPMGLTAVFSLVPGMGSIIDAAVDSFLSNWEWDIGVPLTLKEMNDWDLAEWDLPRVAPLAAVIALSMRLPSEGFERLLRLTVDGDLGEHSQEYSVAFWEYVCGYLVEDRDSDGFWSPSEEWLSGFFRHLPPRTRLPNINDELAHRALVFFWENLSSLDLETYHGESLVASHVAALLHSHPLTQQDLRVQAEQFLASRENDDDSEPLNN